jgi:hypothetical protein
MTALAVSALASTTTLSRGSFSGTFAEGFTTGASSSAAVTATATSKGNVGDIVIGNSIPTIAKTQGASGATTEAASVTFPTLTNTQTFTLAGVTIVAGSGGVSAANLAAAFASKSTAGATIAVVGTAGTNNDFTVTTGASTLNGYTTSSATGAVVVFTSSSASAIVTDLEATGANASAVGIVITAQGAAAATTESNVITFKALNPNDFVTVNGLTFTARVNMTANEVAAAFANIAASATTGSSTKGTYSGTLTAFSSGPKNASSDVTFTSTTRFVTATDIAVSSSTTVAGGQIALSPTVSTPAAKQGAAGGGIYLGGAGAFSKSGSLSVVAGSATSVTSATVT